MTSQLFKQATSLPSNLTLPAFTTHLKTPELFRNTNYINGQWVVPSRSGSDSTFEVRDPTTNEVVGHAPDLNAEEVKEAIQAAHDVRLSWAKTSVKVSLPFHSKRV
jgi:delta 1-pyrroline-5-carboxylate dehydrogenase